MLLDEVLSVGDIEFQAKWMTRLREFLTRGTTLGLVSHSPEAVLDLWPAGRLAPRWARGGQRTGGRVVRAFVDHAVAGQPQTAAG